MTQKIKFLAKPRIISGEAVYGITIPKAYVDNKLLKIGDNYWFEVELDA